MTPRQAMNFIRYHGVVLEAAKGLEPSLAEHVAGEPIRGSWWGHPKGHEIYELTMKVHDSEAVLTCTLARGRITYVHRRLWPPFVRMAEKFPPHALDKVREVHSPFGRHQRQDIPFPQWVPEPVLIASESLSAREATHEIQIWLDRYSAG
jgi:hypothetical protein